MREVVKMATSMIEKPIFMCSVEKFEYLKQELEGTPAQTSVYTSKMFKEGRTLMAEFRFVEKDLSGIKRMHKIRQNITVYNSFI